MNVDWDKEIVGDDPEATVTIDDKNDKIDKT